MAFIPRRKKKIDINKNGNWGVFDEGDQFKLLIDGKDISDILVVELINDGDMMVFNPETSYYYLLSNFENVNENDLQPVEGFKSESGTAFVSFKDFSTYHFFLNGEIISSQSTTFWCDDDLIFWIPTTNKYYFFDREKTIEDNIILIPEHIDLPNETLWIKNNGYYLYNKGIRVTENIKSVYLGPNFLVCDIDNKSWYQLTNYKNQPNDTYFSAEIIDLQSARLWAKTTEKGSFQIIDQGTLISADNMTAGYAVDDVVVYIHNEAIHYLMKNFRDRELYKLGIPQLLPTNTHAVWTKTNHNKFKLFVEGKDLNTHVETNLMDGNLILHHKPTGKLYVCMDYKNQQLNQFQPAVIMDA